MGDKVNKMQWLLAVIVSVILLIASAVVASHTRAQTTIEHHRAVFQSDDGTITGRAELQVDGAGVLHVVLHTGGLEPGQTYENHIHEGATVANQGPILLPLTPLVANAAGKATARTTVQLSEDLDLGNQTIGVHFNDGTVAAKGEIE